MPAAPEPRRLFSTTVEPLVACASVFLASSANRPFLAAALKGQPLGELRTWGFVLPLLAALVALHYLLLAPLVGRRTVKPLLALLFVASALASHYMQAFGVVIDPSMVRNVWRTDPAEARELLSGRLALHLLLYAGLPLAVLWQVRVLDRPAARAVAWRLASLLLAALLLAGAVLFAFKPLASLMRNHKEARYLVTPANLLWSAGSVAAAQVRGAARPRQPIGLDATPGPLWAARTKPLLVVLVVGETARAANWGLSGYARPTTPQLAQLPVLNFSDVTSCGTDTETSLPCMFAPIGRRDYDAARIRNSESLLHVLARAGVAVHWRDNQSGCKGVCAGLPQDEVMSLNGALNPAGACADGRCLDEGLLAGLPQRLAAARGTQLLVLHQLGNHGPSYFRRYPPAFAHFTPACESDDLQQCSQQQIVNAYDNALRYTDHVLATLIATLRASAGEVDSALVYVSDHGESLGENNLFLHGLPYLVAPAQQKRVPMVMWFSAGFPQAAALDVTCLARRAAQPASHDHLFHTLLGLLDVRTALHEPPWDLTHGCRTPGAR